MLTYFHICQNVKKIKVDYNNGLYYYYNMRNYTLIYIALLLFTAFVIWMSNNPWWSLLILLAPSLSGPSIEDEDNEDKNF